MAAIPTAGHEDAKVNEQSDETNTHKEKKLEHNHNYTDHPRERGAQLPDGSNV